LHGLDARNVMMMMMMMMMMTMFHADFPDGNRIYLKNISINLNNTSRKS